ncbi:MAG: PaaI family thioesterase [Acidobacteria bacterium]|nr:PaaI family thioesterase [Acidobacteriota bacterium]
MSEFDLSEERRARVFEVFKTVPYARHLGLELVGLGPGEATVKLAVRDEFRQLYGLLHGGATASLIDTATAMAIIGAFGEDEPTTTIDLNVQYLRPAVEGEIFCTAKIIRAGKRIIFLSAEVIDDQNRIVATALSTYTKV